MSDVMMTVREALAEILQVDVETIKPESNLRDELQVDSLDTIELLMEAEDKYNIEIDSNEVDPEVISTVQDIADFVESKIKKD